MQFSGKPFFQIPRPIRRKGHLNIETMAGNKTLVHKDSYFQVLDPNGSDRDVVLPAELDGLAYHIRHSGSANSLNVKNDAGSVVLTLAANESAVYACDGTTWTAL
jgi:hypothetical protein